MDMSEKNELQVRVEQLERENLQLKLMLCEANIMGIKQNVSFSMEKLPILEAKAEEYRKLLEPKQTKGALV